MFINNKKSLKILKGVIKIHKSKKDRQHNGQKKRGKQQSPKQYTNYKRSIIINPTKKRR